MRKIVRYTFLAIFAVLIQLAVILVASTLIAQRAECKISSAVSEVQTVPEKEAERVSLYGVNLYREEQKLNTLEYDEGLFMSASQRARDIHYGRTTFSHDNWVSVLNTNYGTYIAAGENLAKDFADDYKVLEAWEKSPTHNDVLLSKKACEYGFAKFGTVYVLHVGCKK